MKCSHVLGISLLSVLVLYVLYAVVLTVVVRNDAWFDTENEEDLPDFKRSRWPMSKKQWIKDVATVMDAAPAANVKRGDHVFEVGCGTCAFLDELIRRTPGIHISGNDINETALARCDKKYPDSMFYHGDLLNVNQEGTFDCIVGNGVLGYMHTLEDVRKTLIKCGKMLKTGKTMRFTMLDPPITLGRFLTFQCSLTSARLRIPPSLFTTFGKEHDFDVSVHFTNAMNGQNGRRYFIAMRKR